MQSPEVLVVGETPSLGRSIADLLESGNVPCRVVYDISAERPLGTLSQRFRMIIVACNERFCATARRWARGELPKSELIVVGSRDPALASMVGVRVVPLPLVPGPLLALVRGAGSSSLGSPSSSVAGRA